MDCVYEFVSNCLGYVTAKKWQELAKLGSHLIMHRTNGCYQTPNPSPLVH